MKVIICGGRDFHDQTNAFEVLDELHKQINITHVIQGGAKGADLIGKRWAQARSIPSTEVKAEWDLYGKSAGYKRNLRMAEEFTPDLIIAFPGGVGTKMMCDIGKRKGIEVVEL